MENLMEFVMEFYMSRKVHIRYQITFATQISQRKLLLFKKFPRNSDNHLSCQCSRKILKNTMKKGEILIIKF